MTVTTKFKLELTRNRI